MKESRAPVPPRVSPRPKRGGLLSSSRAILKNGGLCGHCSRDLPLDRRLLFVAELTGRNWWVGSVTLRRRSGGTAALQAARGLYAANNPGNGGMNRWVGFATTETLSTTECTDLELQFSQWCSVFQWFEMPPWQINLKTGCGGRDRTGDTRRMKPLPYHLATPLL